MLNLDMKLDTRQVDKAIRRVVKDVKKPQQYLRKIGHEQETESKRRIRMTKSDPDNRAWTPWSYATRKARMADGSAGRGLLYKTGLLLSNFKTSVERTKMVLANKTNYAKYLQFGTQFMKARMFLGWGKESEKTTLKQGIKFFGRGWR